MISACAPCPYVGASAISNVIVAVVVIVIFLMLGAAISFLFFGYLAYLENYADMPHEEEAHNDH